MGWRDDDQEFFNQVQDREIAPPKPGECRLCDKRCGKCGVTEHQHTQAGRIECAWRGRPCVTCGCPPHPDNIDTDDSRTPHTPIAAFCARYSHPADTLADRELRRSTAWHRDIAGPFYTFRHCSHIHGKPEPAGVTA